MQMVIVYGRNKMEVKEILKIRKWLKAIIKKRGYPIGTIPKGYNR